MPNLGGFRPGYGSYETTSASSESNDIFKNLTEEQTQKLAEFFALYIKDLKTEDLGKNILP